MTNTNLKFYKPGQSGNPGGRPKDPKDLVDARRVNQYEFERAANKFLYMSADDLEKELAKPKVTVLERMIGTIALKATKRGDVRRAEWLLTRLLGKVRQAVDITATSTTNDNRRLQVNINVPGTEELALDSPNLTMAQLEAFQEKIGKIKTELGADKLELPPSGGEPGTIDVESVPGEERLESRDDGDEIPFEP